MNLRCFLLFFLFIINGCNFIHKDYLTNHEWVVGSISEKDSTYYFKNPKEKLTIHFYPNNLVTIINEGETISLKYKVDNGYIYFEKGSLFGIKCKYSVERKGLTMFNVNSDNHNDWYPSYRFYPANDTSSSAYHFYEVFGRAIPN